MSVKVYVLRPDGTSLWLPELLAERIGVKDGDKLAEWQFGLPCIQELIASRLPKKPEGERSLTL